LFFWPTRALIVSLSNDVGEPHFYDVRIDAFFTPDLFQARGETFLKSSIAPAACA